MGPIVVWLEEFKKKSTLIKTCVGRIHYQLDRIISVLPAIESLSELNRRALSKQKTSVLFSSCG